MFGVEMGSEKMVHYSYRQISFILKNFVFSDILIFLASWGHFEVFGALSDYFWLECGPRDPKWILLFWRLPLSYWKTKGIFFALLEITVRSNELSSLFWRAPPSYWTTLSPREMPTEFSTLLEITTGLLEDQMTVICSSGKHHCFTVSKRNPNWIFCSSGEPHRLAGRLCLQERFQMNFLLFWRLPNEFSLLFWRALPSYWT